VVGEGAEEAETIAEVAANITTYVDTMAVMGKTYIYYVFAYNANGGAASNKVTVTMGGGAPTYTVTVSGGTDCHHHSKRGSSGQDF